MRRELFRKVRNRQVLQLLASVDHELAMLSPNGAMNHRRESLRQQFLLLTGIYQGMWLPYRNETVAAFRRRSKRLCTMTLERLQEAMRLFKIPVA